jgi:hypothetical protein
MQDSKGHTLAVGQTVTFTTWDNSDAKAPKAVPTLGTITALSGESLANQTLGNATLDTDAGEVTVASASVTITTAKRKAAPAASAPAKKKSAAKKTTAAAAPATPPAAK